MSDLFVVCIALIVAVAAPAVLAVAYWRQERRGADNADLPVGPGPR